jgi:hypothetical protein
VLNSNCHLLLLLPNTQAVADKTSVDYYFDSYSHFGIHEEMIKDTIRTKSYLDAIRYNTELFQDKVTNDYSARACLALVSILHSAQCCDHACCSLLQYR